MPSKKTRQTFAKLQREQLVREKRAKKQLKKRNAAAAREAVSDDAAPAPE